MPIKTREEIILCARAAINATSAIGIDLEKEKVKSQIDDFREACKIDKSQVEIIERLVEDGRYCYKKAEEAELGEKEGWREAGRNSFSSAEDVIYLSTVHKISGYTVRGGAWETL